MNGGSAQSANFDDGDLNYDEGIVSNMVQASAELAVRWGFLGAYVRGLGFYDFETELSDRERTDLSNDADRYVGKRGELRDYYLDARFRVRGMPVQLRVGDQVLNWGESTFLRFGVQIVNPLDLVALFRPASSAQDLQIPQGMVWAAAILTEEVAIEGYYQYDWEPVRTPPIGWYFSDNDTLGAGELGAAMAGTGLFSDLGTDLDRAPSGSRPAPSASIPTSCGSPGSAPTSRATRGRAASRCRPSSRPSTRPSSPSTSSTTTAVCPS